MMLKMQKLIKDEMVFNFNDKVVETIDDAISEVLVWDTSGVLDGDEPYNVGKEYIINNSSIRFTIEDDSWVNLVFNIIEFNEENIYESKIEDAYIELI